MNRGEDRYPPPGVAEGRVAAFLAREAETSTAPADPLDRLYQTLSRFTFLTDRLREAIDPALARHVRVTGWQDGILRVRLDEPALATRWRFAAPGLVRTLARVRGFEGLREVRLSMMRIELGTLSHRRSGPSTLGNAPVDAIEAMAAGAREPSLKRALERLAEAARAAHGRGA